MQTQKPILFTGAFCSSEEWVEPILSVFPSMRYLPHFFSPQSEAMAIFSFKEEYPCISLEENNAYSPFIAEFFGYKLGTENVKGGAFGSSFKQLYHRFVDKYHILKETKKEIRPLIYDKHGIFLAEWLHKHYQTDIIILIEHPLDFVSKWLENKNSTDCTALFSPKIIKYAPIILEQIELEKENNTFEQLEEWEKALRVWLVFAETIFYYQLNYPDWLFFRYDDFRQAPERTLTDICDMLDLDYTKVFLKKIDETQEARNKETINKDAEIKNPEYQKELLKQAQEYLTHFFPNSIIGKSIFR